MVSYNDNEHSRSQPRSEASGQAAILLVETLLHKLVERSIISLKDAVEIVDTAIEVGAETQDDANSPTAANPGTMAMLTTIGDSLRADLRTR